MWVLVMMAFVGGTGTGVTIESLPGFKTEIDCRLAASVLVNKFNTTFSKAGTAIGECIRQ